MLGFKSLVALLLVLAQLGQAALVLKLLNLTFVNSSGAKCLDGSRAGYYFEQGSVPNKWVISIEGGGLCLDEPSCTSRSKTELGTSTKFTSTMTGGNVVDSSPVANPGFYNWTRVYIPYCSGDLWTGTRRTTSNETFGLYFAGHLIIQGVIQELIDRYNIEDAAEILLKGSSAGSLGLTSNIDWFNNRFPNAQISAVMNAGWFTDFTPSWNGPSFPDLLKVAEVLYQGRMNEACSAANPGNSTFCVFPRYAWRYIPNRLFSLNSVIDTNLLGHLGLYPSSYGKPGAKDYMIAVGHYGNFSILEDFMRSPRRDGLFITTCPIHVVPFDQSLKLQGRTGMTTLVNWYYKLSGSAISYDQCTIESAVNLVVTTPSLLNNCMALIEQCTKISSPSSFERALLSDETVAPFAEYPSPEYIPEVMPEMPSGTLTSLGVSTTPLLVLAYLGAFLL